jgi:hypothetical protein
MNGIRRILAALAGIALALAAASAAFASLPPHGGGDTPGPPVSSPCTPECSPGLVKKPQTINTLS